MRRFHLGLVLIVLIAITGIWSGCKSGAGQPDDALTREGKIPTFFKNIPADAPYVMTGTEAFPFDLLEGAFSKLAESMEQLFQRAEDDGEFNQEDSAARVVFAVMREFRGKLSRNGLESLGFSMRPHFALYGVGLLPVYRMELHDPAAFEGFLARIEAGSGADVLHKTLGEIAYREYALDDLIVPVAIIGNEVIVGATTRKGVDAFLPYMLGLKLPQKSLADHNRIKDVINAYNLSAFGAGYVDFEAITAALLGRLEPGSIMAEIWQALELKALDVTPGCDEEFSAIVADVPRVVFGYEKLTRAEMDTVFAFEVKSDFATRLGETRAPIPGLNSPLAAQAWIYGGLGVDVQKLAVFLSDLALRVRATPYQCKSMAMLNSAAVQMQMTPDQLPPFITQLRGVALMVKHFAVGEDFESPTQFDVVALVDSSEPADLFKILQMVLPFLHGVILEPNGIPTPLPEIAEYAYLVVPHVAMTSSVLAFSAGVGMQDDLAALLERGPGARTPLVMLSYDYAKISKSLLYNIESGDSETLELMSSLSELFGKIVMTIDAEPRGIFVRYHAELMPAAQ